MKVNEEKNSAVPSSETGDELFVIAVDGDGATCAVVPKADLKSELHKLMCTCDASWDTCETEYVTDACESLDDDDAWTHPYPTGKRFHWSYVTEEEPITVTRVTGSRGVTQCQHKHLTT